MIDGYRLVLASSVGARDGMGLELRRDDGSWVAEVFEDDRTKRRTVTLFESNVPLAAIEWLIEEARNGL
jgi:outer membrane lipoprotein SlyB